MILAPAAIAVTALAQQPKLVPFTVGDDSYVNSLNRNGEWATYQKQADASPELEISVINMNDGSFKKYMPAKMIDYRGIEVEMVSGSYSRANWISNDGKTIYGTINGYPGYFTVDDLTWHCLSMGDRHANNTYVGEVYSASEDGSVIVGWHSTGSSMTEFGSNVWVNNELKELTKLPTYKDLYDHKIITKAIYDEYKDKTPNYLFSSVSSDGNLILVGVNHNFPGWGCSYGVYDISKDTFNFILASRDEVGESFTDNADMSDNGVWVAGNITMMEGELESVSAPYRYNTVTKELDLYYEMADRDILVSAIDNNGTIFGSTPGGQPMRNLVIRSGKLWVDLGKILDQKYGVDFTGKTKFETSGYAVAVSKDCKTIVAQAEMRGGAYALTMPVNFNEAAEGTSLLTEYMTSPAPGSQFAHLTSMMIRFGYEATPTGQDIAVVKDSKGNVVTRSTAVESFSAQNLVYTIKFPDTRMNENETYTVNIPAGSFVVPGTTMGNVEINVPYKGRADRAVRVTDINPQDGGYMRELSYNSPVIVTFDAQLIASNAVQPKLYEEGKEAPIATLSAMVDGNKLSIYAPAERKLRNEVKYRVEVPAGLVADLGETGQNEAFDIEINGTYIPTPDIYPFRDNFNSPNESLSRWLMYEGDHNSPSEDMESLGFDRDNTPWNFSIRDDGSDDYAAMSHSMYSPAGKSDDWMLTTNINIANEDYYLTFKAQGFNANKQDVLKIYVWEYDDVINSIDSEMAAKMKAEAKLFKEFVVTPSQTAGVLEGNWTDYEFSLKEFAGKKIYIGFVNQNENQSAIIIDDVLVDVRSDYSVTVVIPDKVVDQDSLEIKGILNCTSDNQINEYSATLLDGDGKTISTITETVSLTKGQSHNFTFPEKLPLEAGVHNKFTVVMKVGSVEQRLESTIANHLFDIPRRILLEESTGMWCGNCPKGEIAIEHIEEQMPDDVVVISVHNDDAVAYAEYDQFLAPGGYPGGRVNRSQKVYSPLYVDPDKGDYTYTSPQGDQTFMDAILSELTKGVEGLVEIVNPVYYSADKVIAFDINARFSLNSNNRSYTVFSCILEDGLTGRQTNYMAGTKTEIDDWWSAQPGMVQYTFKNVARKVIGGMYGESDRIPREITAGTDYTSKAVCPLPAAGLTDSQKNPVYVNPDNMHFVVALLDASTGKVVNAAVCREFEVNDTPGAGVEGVADSETIININVADGTIYVNGENDVEVYTVSGARVNNASLANGIYIIRKAFGDGSVYSGKVLVK